MTASSANRGKEAEDLLRKHLTKMNNSLDTAFYRLPDAHAGSKMPTLADFLMLRKGSLLLIECKQVKHEFRLPHGNFAVEQVARQRIWKEAGATSIVLIYHTPLKLWRGYDIDRFITREGGSWDLRDTTPDTLVNLLE